MSILTTIMGLGKAEGTDNSETYLEVTLAAALDILDTHAHESGKGNPVKRVQNGVAASRPAAGNAGHVYIATDTGIASFDTGAAWVDLLSGTAPTVSSFANANHTHASTAQGGHLSDPMIRDNFYVGSSTQSLPSASGNTGKWRFHKASGGTLLTNPASGEALWAPGATGANSTNTGYTSPNGESVFWLCNGTTWYAV